MAINREKIHDIVEVFYQPTFKTFYVNSVDEKTLIKPIGVFVSLGITTSTKVLEDVKNILLDNGYDAKIAEISSKKASDRFLNTLTNTTNPKQYKLTDFDDSIMDESQAKAKLSEMRAKMNPENNVEDLKELAPKVSRLQDLIDKLTDSNGWDAHLIQYDNGEYRIFHQYVNYKKENDTEYRIGIFVSEKN